MPDIPMWVMLVFLCMIGSGFMAFRTQRHDYQTEQQFIEREGNVYMERMEEERAKRNTQINAHEKDRNE
ncbi:Sporulation protein YhaL [Terribacillus aidingensis]|uniref:Sporulation protein YhaL n=1 Tax=Terribacillus aidingensis TaxID=586416 RepID=A0A285NY29_9BACI|nr:sporulation YhaL family protein [Terribacillus aidingensis]SNZ14394.1 Sporulation protein YhaL [Terribacillus aidingensis]